MSIANFSRFLIRFDRIFPAGRAARWLRKFACFSATPDAAEGLSEELERLVQTSPHLLTDIGLEQVACAGGGKKDVWTGRGLRVVTRSLGREIVVTADGPGE